MSYNQAESCILLQHRPPGVSEKCFYELYNVPRTSDGNNTTSVTEEPKIGPATTALWVARNRFATLDRNNQVFIIQHYCFYIHKKWVSNMFFKILDCH